MDGSTPGCALNLAKERLGRAAATRCAPDKFTSATANANDAFPLGSFSVGPAFPAFPVLLFLALSTRRFWSVIASAWYATA